MEMKRWVAAALALALALGAAGCRKDGGSLASIQAEAADLPTVQPGRPDIEDVRPIVFDDVPESAPYAGPVYYTARLGVLGGTGQGIWSPERYADRACAATVLYRLSGAGERSYLATFADVEPGSWYAPAVTWAVAEGLLAGREDGLFHPDEPITRAELAVLIYRYAGSRGMDTENWKALSDAPGDHLKRYWDGDAGCTDWGGEALAWCTYNGLLTPITDAWLHPGFPVTRLQLAQVLTAFQAADDLEAEEIYRGQTAGMESRSVANHEALQADIDAIAKSYGAAAVQVAVIEKGRVTDSFVYGKAKRTQMVAVDVKTGETVTVDDGSMQMENKLRVASISKVVVAMNAFALAEDGKLDLDGSIGQYWNCTAKNRACPDVPVSIRSILTHTSTIPMYSDDTSRRYDSVRQRLANGKFSGGQPGNLGAWGYNNYAFGVLGMTLELSQNRRYDDIAREYFFDPLDIDAGVVPGELKDTSLLCDIFRHNGEVGRSAQTQKKMRYTYAPGDYGNYFCGGLTISAVDLAKLFAVLAGDGTYAGQRLLSEASVEAMERSIGTPSGQAFEQCHPLRLQHDIYGRKSLYYHTGSAYGVFNLASYDPDTGDGVVVLTTGASGAKDIHGIYTVCARISHSVYAVTGGGMLSEQVKAVLRD